MSKGLNQYSGRERREVIKRRLTKDAGGLGTLAAKDAQKYVLVEAVVEVEADDVEPTTTQE